MKTIHPNSPPGSLSRGADAPSGQSANINTRFKKVADALKAAGYTADPQHDSDWLVRGLYRGDSSMLHVIVKMPRRDGEAGMMSAHAIGPCSHEQQLHLVRQLRTRRIRFADHDRGVLIIVAYAKTTAAGDRRFSTLKQLCKS